MSDEDVLILVGKLVSRATTLMFCPFPDSDRNIMKNAEQANRRTSQSIPDGIEVAPEGMEELHLPGQESPLPGFIAWRARRISFTKFYLEGIP